MARRRSRWESSVYQGQYLAYNSNIPVGEIMYDDIGLHVNKPCTHSSGSISSEGAIRTVDLTGQWPSSNGEWVPGTDGRLGGGYYCQNSPYVKRYGSIPMPPIEDAHASIVQGLVETVRESGRSSLHAISFVREISSTIAMFKNPFKVLDFVRKHSGLKPGSSVPLKTAFKRAHRRANKHARKQPGVVDRATNTWLEGTYGWNPFLSDLATLAAGVGSAVESRRRLAGQGPVKYRRTRTGATTVELPSLGDSPQYRTYCSSGSVTSSWKVVYWGSLEVSPSAQSESYLSSAARALNLDRLGYAVWDAVPYSFVADWFLPLGAKIDSALSGPAFYSYCSFPWYSQKSTVKVSMAYSASSLYTTGNGSTGFRGSASYRETAKTFIRAQVDPASFDVENPSGMHGTRIASGFALAWGRIR